MDSLSLQGNISKLTLPVSYELQEVSAQLDLHSYFVSHQIGSIGCHHPLTQQSLSKNDNSAKNQTQDSWARSTNVLCLWVAEKPTLERMSLETFSKTSEARVFIRINLIRKHRLLKNVEDLSSPLRRSHSWSGLNFNGEKRALLLPHSFQINIFLGYFFLRQYSLS